MGYKFKRKEENRMFGALFRHLLLVDEYYDIQIFYDSNEKVFFVLDGDEFDENKITVTRIDSENKYYLSMYETYIEKEENKNA